MNTAIQANSLMESGITTNPGSILLQQSDVTEASLEAIELLEDQHREAVLNSYRENLQNKVMIDAAVTYLAVRVAMAKTAEANINEFRAAALEPAPWFVGEFDVQLLAKRLLHETEMDTDTSDILVDEVVYQARLAAIKAVFGL